MKMTTEDKSELVIDDGRIESIEEFQTPEQLYEELILRVRKYHPSADISLIQKAYQVASQARLPRWTGWWTSRSIPPLTPCAARTA